MAGFALVIGRGWAHETLHDRGLSEMALAWLCDGLAMDVRWNVEETTSVVLLGGEPSDVVGALRTLDGRLATGPDRLPEHRITATADPDAALLLRRYGYRSYGLAGAPRFGYQTADTAAVRSWLAGIGTRSSRLLGWDVEPGLLSLGGGVTLDEPAVEPVLAPGWIVGSSAAELTWTGDRGPTATVATQIIASALGSVVPAPAPNAHGVVTFARYLGASTRHVTVLVNDRQAPDVFAAPMLAELDRLCADGPGELEIVDAVDRHSRDQSVSPVEGHIREAKADLWRASGYALPDDSTLRAESVVLREEIRRQCATLVLASPSEPVGSAVVRPAVDLRPNTEVRGTTYRPRYTLVQSGMRRGQRMVTTEDRLVYEGQARSTVTAGTVAIVERRPDGERVLYDGGGGTLVVDPLVWTRGERLVAWVDSHLGPHVERSERLPADPYVVQAVRRSSPLGPVLGSVFMVVVAMTFFIGAIAESSVGLALTGVAFLGAAVGFLLLRRFTQRLHRRVRE